MSWLPQIGLSRPAPRIAALTPIHAERLAEIHAVAFARPWSAIEFEGFLTDRLIYADGLFLGRAQQPAGFALSRVTLDEAEVLSVALDRTARGQGHARLLLAHHLDTLARAGAACAHLEVEEGNVPAFALYRRLGFRQSGLRPGYYARPDGSRATAVSMTKDLEFPPAPLPS